MRIPFTNFEIVRQQRAPKPPADKPRDSARPQTREALDHPFSQSFNEYHPLKHNIGLFRVIRESIPFIDIAISKMIRLVGDFEFVGDDEKLLAELEDFKANVQVNWYNQGLMAWVGELMDSTITTGMGFGEIVPFATYDGIHRLKTCKSDDFRFTQDDKGRMVIGIKTADSIEIKPLEHPEYVAYLAFDQRDGHPQGYSMLYSLPFVTQVFLRMEKSWENFSYRVADPTFMIVVEGGPDQMPKDVMTIASEIQGQVQEVMALRRKGQTGDVYGGIPNGGKVEIKALAGDVQMFEMEVPTRTILEQIIAKTGLPPFMLGLSWSTTERMSKDQNDLIVSNIKYQRMRIEPIVRRVIDLYLTMTNRAGTEWDMEWLPVNLLDEAEEAKARLFNAQAAEKEINNVVVMMSMGFMDNEQAEEYLIEQGIKGVRLNRAFCEARLKQIIAEKAAKNIYYQWGE